MTVSSLACKLNLLILISVCCCSIEAYYLSLLMGLVNYMAYLLDCIAICVEINRRKVLTGTVGTC